MFLQRFVLSVYFTIKSCPYPCNSAGVAAESDAIGGSVFSFRSFMPVIFRPQNTNSGKIRLPRELKKTILFPKKTKKELT